MNHGSTGSNGNNPTGLHARPASLLVAQAAKSKSKVIILFNNKTINAKSMLSLLVAGASAKDRRL